MEAFTKVIFAADHYLRAFAFLLAALGVGDLLLARLKDTLMHDALTWIALSCATGMAALILAIIGLGLGGGFNATALGLLLGSALLLGVYSRLTWALTARHSGLGGVDVAQLRSIPWWIWLAILAAMVPHLIRPLNPPLEWDEVMYHMPYVRFWAENGELAVNEMVRYPLFPYSYHMLYVAAFVLGSDVLTHLVHGLAGWLTTLLILAVGLRYYGRAVAVLAAVLFLAAAGAWQFSSAYIDLALTFFVCASLFALLLAHELKRVGFVYLSALLIGTALGIKYQAALFLAMWGCLLLAVEKRPLQLLLAIAIVALFGGYWYLRNFILVGDPVHPLGGNFFGFYLWDATDLAGQLKDARKAIELPHPLLWMPALAAVMLWRSPPPITRWLIGIAAYSVGTWILTSGHSRYLMPAFPVIALLAAHSVVRGTALIAAAPAWQAWRASLRPRTAGALKAMLVVLVAAAFFPQSKKAWDRIAVTQDDRDRIVAERLKGYTLFRILSADTSIRLFQVGFEGQLYYAPPCTIGETFGPGRFRTIYELAARPADLANHLRKLGANSIAINDEIAAFRNLRFPPTMTEYFDLILERPIARVYRLKERPLLAQEATSASTTCSRRR